MYVSVNVSVSYGLDSQKGCRNMGEINLVLPKRNFVFCFNFSWHTLLPIPYVHELSKLSKMSLLKNDSPAVVPADHVHSSGPS